MREENKYYHVRITLYDKLHMWAKNFCANGDKYFLKETLGLLFFGCNLYKWEEYFGCSLRRGKTKVTFLATTYLTPLFLFFTKFIFLQKCTPKNKTWIKPCNFMFLAILIPQVMCIQ